MPREIDLTKPLSAEDVAYLRSRHPLPVVERMIALAGAEDSPEPSAPAEEPESTEEDPAKAEATEEPDGTEDDTEEPDEDLIGDVAEAAELYDPFTHTTVEVREYMKQADPEERERVRKVELDRTDREPRTSITEYNPA